MAATPLVLHVWPGRWDLPSFDPSCLEAVLFLQLTFPGHYSVVETADPDLSPSGQLPFLTHGHIAISPLSSIISYLSALDPSLLNPSDPENEFEGIPSTIKPDLDAGLSVLQLSQRTAWRAYIEAQLGDLVAYSFFVLEPNYVTFTHGILVSMLSVPQRYYIPHRLRESYRPRLEASGLWQIANESEDGRENDKKKNEARDQQIKRTFGQAKLVERAKLVLDILSRLLIDKQFIFGERISSVDLVLASRILLLIKPPLPNPALKDLLEVSYPALISHATRVHALAFPASPSMSNPTPPILAPARVNPLNVLKLSLKYLFRRGPSRPEESEEVKRFRRYRWGWIALAVAGAAGYILTQGFPIVFVITQKEPDEAEEGAGEDEELPDEAVIEDG